MIRKAFFIKTDPKYGTESKQKLLSNRLIPIYYGKMVDMV